MKKIEEQIFEEIGSSKTLNPTNKLLNTSAQSFWIKDRQYIPPPVTTGLSDQPGFSQWLYGNEFVCKAGSVSYGVNFNENSLVCDGNNIPNMTNKGIPNLMSSVQQ